MWLYYEQWDIQDIFIKPLGKRDWTQIWKLSIFTVKVWDQIKYSANWVDHGYPIQHTAWIQCSPTSICSIQWMTDFRDNNSMTPSENDLMAQAKWKCPRKNRYDSVHLNFFRGYSIARFNNVANAFLVKKCMYRETDIILTHINRTKYVSYSESCD